MRRQVIVFALVFLKLNGKAQLTLNLLLAVAEVVIIARYKPFRSKIDNRVSLLNESLLLLVYVLFLMITFYSEEQPSTRDFLGSLTVSIACALNVVNILIMFFEKIKGCKQQCKKRKHPSIKYLKKSSVRPLEESGNPSRPFETTKHTQNESICHLGANLSISFFEKGEEELHRSSRYQRTKVLPTIRQMPVQSEHQNDIEVQDL